MYVEIIKKEDGKEETISASEVLVSSASRVDDYLIGLGESFLNLREPIIHYRTDSLTDFRIDICSRLAHRIHPLNILYEEV